MSGAIFLLLRLLMALALYAFLGWAIWTLWRDLRRQGELLAIRRLPAITLHSQALESPQDSTFNTPEVLIGRSPACECQLDDKTVSAQHARLSYHHNQWWIEDLDSTNGTFLNSQKVSSPVVLASGDEVRCGQVNLMIELGEKPQGNLQSVETSV